MKRTLSLTAISLALAATLLGGNLSGRRVPSFSLPDATMTYRDVLDYRGKVLLIEVMKTDCPHCQTLAGTLERVRARYGAKIAVLSIVVPPDNLQTVSAFIAKYKINYPILFDCGQTTAALVKATPQNSGIDLPVLLVVDKNGNIVEDYTYVMQNKAIFENDGLFPVLDKLLAGAAAPAPKK